MTPAERLALIAQLEHHEGLRQKPYVDTAGKITIGVGRNLTDVGLSRATVAHMLDEDIDAVVADLSQFPWWAGLAPARQRAVCDLRFNLGRAGFRTFTKFIAALAAGDWAAASWELSASRWAHQVQPDRVACLVAQIQGGAHNE